MAHASHPTAAYACLKAQTPLVPHQIDRRAARDHDVRIEVDYCGVCHSDVHMVRGEWGGSDYPMVPGHEIIGRVVEVGAKARKFAVGDVVGVGVMVDSCRTCASCKEGLQQYCDAGFVATYSGQDRHGDGTTYGGYSAAITTHEDFVLRIPKDMDLARTAPLLCAGITTYSPLRHVHAGPGKKVAIVGIGGLGHTAVKLAVAMGAQVTVITHSQHKRDEARRLGASAVIYSGSKDEMKAAHGSFDIVLSTISAKYAIDDYLALLKRDGHMVVVGLPDEPPRLAMRALIHKRLTLMGSLIGGIQETQEMLDFCAEKKVLCDVEVIPMDDINKAYDRIVKSDVKYRFVVDMKSLK